jgi:hypothetical protein
VNGRGHRGGSEWEIPGGSGAVHLPRGSSNLLHEADDLECEQAELLGEEGDPGEMQKWMRRRSTDSLARQ